MVLTGTSFMLARKFGSKQVGSIIIVGGIVLLVGMLYTSIMLEQLDSNFRVFTVDITPPLFMAVSVPIMIFGARLFKIKKDQRSIFNYDHNAYHLILHENQFFHRKPLHHPCSLKLSCSNFFLCTS
uniref:Uncharacterized protein n=1 Tax=uncultured marine thaumarchaeote SAT1000_05_G10 TaxID=1456358 RepID=A0A075I129_9ARCH|nr:hypothetical protein [uncultured marine thaumarchaeote SAT1000_05_G10]